MNRTRYCAYCRRHQDDVGFKLIPHVESGTRRSMCASCQEIRRKPRTELQRLAEQERAARKGASS